MIFQVILALVTISFADSSTSEEFFVNGGGAYPNQGFYYNYQLQPRSTYYYPENINKPEFHPELGMSPQYHDLVYNYVKDFAGTQPPSEANVFQPFIYNIGQLSPQMNANNDQTMVNGGLQTLQNNQKEVTTESVNQQFSDKPGLNDYFLPSDFLSLPNHPKSQFYGHLDAIKTKRISPKVQPTSLPPIGGVISNYILTRDQKTPQNLFQLFGNFKDNENNLQHIKRETPDENSDGVVILAESTQNSKAVEEMKEEADDKKEEEEDEDKMEAQPGIAQSKPSAIALAGPGGMAQASPVGTALVGQGGLAVAAPSGTAVAGPAGGSIPIHIGGGEKQRKETTEKSEESDAY